MQGRSHCRSHSSRLRKYSHPPRMSTSTPTRCRDIESRYCSLQLSNNHESSAEEASINRPNFSAVHPFKSPAPHKSLSEAEPQRFSQDFRQLPLSSPPYYGLHVPSSKVPAEPENNSVGRHTHALELSASLKLALAQRFCLSDTHECDDNQSDATSAGDRGQGGER